jgi:UDP-glucose 4-epimerase
LGNPENLTYDICSVEEYCANHAKSPNQLSEIYHLASVVGPVGVLRHGGNIAKSIVDDTYRMAALAETSGARLLDVSTSEVYGGGRNGYCSEKDVKIIPPTNSIRLEYAVGKLAAEVALINKSSVRSLEAVIVRPFNIAGPRQSPTGGFVLPRFIGQALSGEPLTVYGDGRMIRAFTHVKDIASGIMRVMQRGKSGEAYNIGNPANKTTILALAERVVKLLDSPSDISFVNPKKLFGPLFEEANDKYPDADRAMNGLGWKPTRDLDTIILEAADYIKSGRKD